MYNVEDINSFANIILEKYYFYTKKNYLPKVIKDFIVKLGKNCAGLFSEEDVWSVVRILHEHNYLTEEIIENSSVQKYLKTSNPRVNDTIKIEIEGFASNKRIKHINKDDSEVSEFVTRCYTVDSMVNQIKFGELVCTFSFSNKGFDLDEEVEIDSKSRIDFTKNNLLVKLKEDICSEGSRKYVSIVILKAIEA